jgi:hypothetical protein
MAESKRSLDSESRKLMPAGNLVLSIEKCKFWYVLSMDLSWHIFAKNSSQPYYKMESE